MSPRSEARTQQCNRQHARNRAAQAEAFVTTAELVLDVDDEASPHVAAALAVLAGIAASDAACCFALGRRPRGQDHRPAVELLAGIAPNGGEMGKDLARLLDIKDNAHYGMVFVSKAQANRALRWARRMLNHAEMVLQS